MGVGSMSATRAARSSWRLVSRGRIWDCDGRKKMGNALGGVAMQQFPPNQSGPPPYQGRSQGVVQCPHCGGCSVPPTALPPGTVVACPNCRQTFAYQPVSYQPAPQLVPV